MRPEVPFRDVILQHGHRRIVELLSRSVARATLPPSLIFAGARGTGKRATAVAVAQALNCANPSSQTDGGSRDSCGVCSACVRIARGVHPDFLIVEPGDNGTIRIDQVRDLIDRSAYRPFEGKCRVVVIDDADALVPGAQNALLKTLEEPPSSSVFILVTSRPDVLLPTVRSRCIRLSFAESRPVDVDAGARGVAQRVLAEAAAGSDAKRLEAAKDLLTGTGAGAAADRTQVAAHLHAMAALLRDIEAIAARADSVALGNADVRPLLERLAPSYQGERGVNAFGAIDRALAAIERNAGIKVVADWLVLQL
jgi:DNA polymerase-3 subunit delta'